MQILESDLEILDKNRATNNGIMPPLYITKQGAKGPEEKKEGEEEVKHTKQVHLKLQKR